MATLSFTKAKIGAPDISFGTGTFARKKSDGTYMNVNQVNAASIPLFDTGAHFANDRVEYALGYCATRIKTVSASLTTGLAGKVSTAVTTSISATLASCVKYWWKSPTGTIQNTSGTRITFPAGYYPVGGKIYYAANTIGWSTQRGGGSVLTQKWSNRGFSFATGAVALGTGWRKSSSWIYLYATTYGGSLAFVGAGTVPTSKYDTGLTGPSWDTNAYVGCAYLNSSSNIVNFNKTANHTLVQNNITFYSRNLRTSTNSRYLPIYIIKPQTADHVNISVKDETVTTGTTMYMSTGSISGEDQFITDNVGVGAGKLKDSIVGIKSNTLTGIMYYYHNQSQNGVFALQTKGWYDKFC
jgi:hypothetical protein